MLAMTYSRYAGCYSEQTNGWSTHTTQINKYLHNIFNNTVILEIREGSHFNLNYSFTLPNGIMQDLSMIMHACSQPNKGVNSYLLLSKDSHSRSKASRNICMFHKRRTATSNPARFYK